MSDEEPTVPGKADLTALRERREQMIADADAAYVAREQAERDDFLGSVRELAEKQLAAYRTLPCRGEIARIGECSDTFAADCSQRKAPSCPRSIRAFDDDRERQLLAERLEASGIPRGVLDIVLGSMEPTEATQAVDEWLPTNKRLLLLSGGLGTGKSVAAGYAIRRTRGRWMHASEIAKAARFEAEERMRVLLTSRLLVIDDLGAEFNDGSGWGRAALTNLLLQRYEDSLRTVITTNLDGKAWGTYADPRIKDRLSGTMGVARVIGGKSRRK